MISENGVRVTDAAKILRDEFNGTIQIRRSIEEENLLKRIQELLVELSELVPTQELSNSFWGIIGIAKVAGNRYLRGQLTPPIVTHVEILLSSLRKELENVV